MGGATLGWDNLESIRGISSQKLLLQIHAADLCSPSSGAFWSDKSVRHPRFQSVNSPWI